MRKVNINTLVRTGQLKTRGISTSKNKPFSPELFWYNTQVEIDFMDFLINSTMIRKMKRNEVYDLGEDRRFLYLSKIEQIKLVISLLYQGYDVVIDGHIELSNQENIDQLKATLKSKLEAEAAYIEKRKPIREQIAKVGYI